MLHKALSRRFALPFALGSGARHLNLSEMCRLQVGWTGVTVAMMVGCGAPVNDYVSTAYMLRFGEEQRRASGRALDEATLYPEARHPLRVAIPLPEKEGVTLEPLAEEPKATPSVFSSPSPERSLTEAVGLDRERLAEYLRRSHEIAVFDVQALNGRLVGGKNVLRIEFVPRARSEESLLREFALVCAAVLGMDRNRTVDTVLLLAIDAQLMPWMSMKTDMAEFEKYHSDAISLKEWQQKIETVRY